ncbi:MAG: toprim domain-containing protein [Alphaproteobacteria bacterium]|nr:toprim domain-containing protein [Alphaproteobacteria bacterium]
MSQAEIIAKALSGERRIGSGWMVRCPMHNDRTPSLSLADGENGRLLVKCFAGCDARSILGFLQECGLPDNSTFASTTLTHPAPLSWSQRADTIFKASLPIRGTLAEKYLLGRGCALPETDEIRYLPSRDAKRYPAMLSRISDAVTGKPLSLHFTLLSQDGTGKAPLERQKLLLSGHRKSGGVVRLINDAEIISGLGITEGIETALSVLRSGWRPVWSALDSGNMGSFPVLAGIHKLTIFADNDHSGRAAAQQCATRWQAAGRAVRIVTPKGEGADWND